MNKELQERIEKLKKPELAQPLALLSEEEQAIFKKAGPDNMLWLVDCGARRGTWADAGSGKNPGHTYILKPKYEPDPEYIEIELEAVNKGVWLKEEAPGWSGDCSICKASMHEDFICFHYMGGAETTNAGQVPNWLRANPDQTIYARFVKN